MYATYNFINAAFNYCQADYVQLLLDEDDELIGRYALKAMDGAYWRANLTKPHFQRISFSINILIFVRNNSCKKV